MPSLMMRRHQALVPIRSADDGVAELWGQQPSFLDGALHVVTVVRENQDVKPHRLAQPFGGRERHGRDLLEARERPVNRVLDDFIGQRLFAADVMIQ